MLVPGKRPQKKQEPTIVRVSAHDLEDLSPGKSAWARLDELTDAEIKAAVRDDPDAAQILTAEWFRKARLVYPENKRALSIRLDQDILAFFKRRGRGYQTRINAVLRAYVEAHSRPAASSKR